MELSIFEEGNFGRMNSADPVILDVYGHPLGSVNPVNVYGGTDAITPTNTIPQVNYTPSSPSFWDSLGQSLGGAISGIAQSGASQVKQQVQSYLPAYQQQYQLPPQPKSNNTLLFVGIGVVLFSIIIMVIALRK